MRRADRDERPSEAPSADARYKTIARAPEVPHHGGRRASAAEGLASPRLGVRPARLVRRSADREAQVRAALRVLYRDFLAGCALDIAGASRSPGRSPHPKRKDQ
ncbi:MAG: hypothetical protein ACRDSN_22980 [Pseudonocardiaceae bacterium]